jgi:hypothetical protein
VIQHDIKETVTLTHKFLSLRIVFKSRRVAEAARPQEMPRCQHTPDKVCQFGLRYASRDLQREMLDNL